MPLVAEDLDLCPGSHGWGLVSSLLLRYLGLACRARRGPVSPNASIAMTTRPDIVTALGEGVVLLDGGMATSLQTCGLEVGSSPELWNLERPDVVRAIHQGFLQAGSQVIQTNSFGGNRVALARHRAQGREIAVNQAAVRLAREACEASDATIVAGSLGPTGLCYDTGTNQPDDQLRSAFVQQIKTLAEGGVDYFSLETFSSIEEARLVVHLIREFTQLPFTVCFTFEERDGELRTPCDDPLVLATLEMVEEGACAVGVNCGCGSAAMTEAVPSLLEFHEVPVIAKPNAGLPELANGVPHYRQDPSEFATHLSQLVSSGVRAVGGCCGCDADFISALRQQLGR